MILAPAGAEILTLQVQPDEDVRRGSGGRLVPVLWAVVDTEMPPVPIEIRCYGTGQQIPDNPGRYLATVQLGGGALVLHYFAPGSI